MEESFHPPTLKTLFRHESVEGHNDRPSRTQDGSEERQKEERARDAPERPVLELDVVDIRVLPGEPPE